MVIQALHKIKPPVQAFCESLVTVDTEVFNRWNAPKPADSNMTHQTETLHKQKVPSGLKLSTGWLTGKAKNPDSQNRETTSFKLIKQSFPWITFNIALGFQQKRLWQIWWYHFHIWAYPLDCFYGLQRIQMSPLFEEQEGHTQNDEFTCHVSVPQILLQSFLFLPILATKFCQDA